MTFYDLVVSRRSIRRFKQTSVPKDLLERCVNAARLAPSAGNRQPFEYIVVTDKKLLPDVFGAVGWAPPEKPHGEPPEGQKPTAYIVQVKNTKKPYINNSVFDQGAAMENMALVALAEGVGSTMFNLHNAEQLRKPLGIPPQCEAALVIALGYPNEVPVVDTFTDSEKYQYWREASGVHHVPKRPMSEIMHWEHY